MTGQPTTYLKTTADSGKPRLQAFCPRCGAPIYSTTPGDGVQPSYTVRVGMLRQRDRAAAEAAELVALGAGLGSPNLRQCRKSRNRADMPWRIGAALTARAEPH